MQKLIEGRRIDAVHSLVLRDQPFARQLDGDAQGRLRGALAVARLQHPELLLLDGELHVLHVAVMPLENAVDAHELRIGLRHCGFHRRLVGGGRLARLLGDVLRRADAGDDILALGVDEELAVELLLARRGIAREGDAGRRGLAHVAEHHRLHVHRGAPARRNAVKLAVLDGAAVHPGAEHRADGAPELLLRILREGRAELARDDRLVGRDQALPVGGGKIGVESEALAVLVGVEGLLEMMVIDAEHDVRIHRDEAAIAVEGEALVAGILGDRGDGRVVEAEVEHRVHHARHRGAGAGAHRDEKRILRIAEGAAGKPSDEGEGGLDLGLKIVGIGAAVVVVIGADLGGDGEAGRHRQSEVGHLGEVRALAAEEVLHPGLALRLAVAEGVDPLRHRPGSLAMLPQRNAGRHGRCRGKTQRPRGGANGEWRVANGEGGDRWQTKGNGSKAAQAPYSPFAIRHSRRGAATGRRLTPSSGRRGARAPSCRPGRGCRGRGHPR
jgi:hypothetical protein